MQYMIYLQLNKGKAILQQYVTADTVEAAWTTGIEAMVADIESLTRDIKYFTLQQTLLTEIQALEDNVSLGKDTTDNYVFEVPTDGLFVVKI